MRNILKLLIMCFLCFGCSSHKALIDIQKQLDLVAQKKDIEILTKTIISLDSTLKSTQINLYEYEINQKKSVYDTLHSPIDILERANKVLKKLRYNPK